MLKNRFTTLLYAMFLLPLHLFAASPFGGPSFGGPSFGPGGGGFPGMQEPTPEELQAFEAELNREIERAVQQMSPEERKLFDETVQRLESMPPEKLERFMSGEMSPEEQEAFFKEAVPAEALNQLPASPAEPKVESTQQTPPTQSGPALPTFNSAEQKAVLELLNALIQRTSAFLSKVYELYGDSGATNQFISWKRQHKIKHVESYKTWGDYKKAVEQIVQRLYKLQEKDPKTGAYKYLGALMTNQGIINNLHALLVSLHEHEPKIVISPFGIGQISSETKKALRTIISAYAEALKVLDIPAAIDQAIASYDPRASELVAAEQKSLDTAATNPPRMRQERVAVGGRDQENTGVYSTSYPSSNDYGSYGGSSYYPSSYDSSPYYSSSNYDSGEKERPARRSRGSSSGSSGRRSGGSVAPKGSHAHDDHAHDHSKGSAPSPKNKTVSSDAPKQTKELVKSKEERMLFTITAALEDAKDALKKHEKVLQNFALELLSKEAVSEKLEKAFETATKKLEAALKETQNLIKLVNKNSKKKDQVKKRLEGLIQEYGREIFDHIQTEAKGIQNQWSEMQKTVSPEKAVAYLGIDTTPSSTPAVPALADSAAETAAKPEDAGTPHESIAADDTDSATKTPAKPAPRKPSLFAIADLWAQFKELSKMNVKEPVPAVTKTK